MSSETLPPELLPGGDGNADVVICAGPPECPFGDDAEQNANDGCPKCRRISITDGGQVEFKAKTQ